MRFEKVSFEQFAKDVPLVNVPRVKLKEWYDQIILPTQGSIYSMGVDFFMPYNVKLLANNKVKIPTGIRWVCEEWDNSDVDNDREYGMLIVPRSSTGTKLGLRLMNTVGIIDADYCDAENEGHIMLMFENTTDNDVKLPKGKAVAQGIITPYIIPNSARSNDKRIGGFGSTDNKK